MKKNLWRRLLPLMLMVLYLSAMLIPVSALEIDTNRKGSISVTIRDGDKPVPGGVMMLYQVAQYYQGSFQATLLFQDSGFDAGRLDSDMAAALAQFASENALTGVAMKIDDTATAAFSQLELGVYLLVQQEAASGYALAAPFLVTVPMQEDGGYVYEVDASPKVVPVPVPSNEPGPDPSTSPSTSPQPSTEPSTQPSTQPSIEPSTQPSAQPSTEPSTGPSTEPSTQPSTSPSQFPTVSLDPGTPGGKLPNTGQLNWPIPVLAVLGMLLFGFGWYQWQKRRER